MMDVITSTMTMIIFFGQRSVSRRNPLFVAVNASLVLLTCRTSRAFSPLLKNFHAVSDAQHETLRISSQLKLQKSPFLGSNSATARTNGDSSFVDLASIDAPSLTTIQEEVPRATCLPKQEYPVPIKIDKTAIILNKNARAVSQDVIDLAIDALGKEHVFVTVSADEAQKAATNIVEKGYSVVVPVGGDGTLSSFLQCLCESMQERYGYSLDQALQTLPLVGYIPLGTGNGVGSVVGCRVTGGIWPGAKRRRQRQLRTVLNQLKAVGEQQLSPDEFETVDLPMMQVSTPSSKNYLCFFAGVGFDSLMLNDFKRIQAWSQRTGLFRKALSSVTGYCVALVVKTLPKCAIKGEHNVHIELSTRSPNDTLWVDHRRGDMVRKIDSALLYKGMTGILAAGTCPFYGGNLRLFPFARMTLDKMHVRVGRIHPLTGFFKIPQIFDGSYRDKSDKFGCIDFIGSDFDVKIISDDNGFPFQHSGESVGHVQEFHLAAMKHPVKFVSFMEKKWRNHQ